jgi:hypothetical protein
MKVRNWFGAGRARFCPALVLLTIACVAGTSIFAKSDETRLRTRLAGAAIGGKTPEGNADFRSELSRGRTRFHVEVEDVNLPAGTMLTVMVSHNQGPSTQVGTMPLDALGAAELELDSQDGDTVPAVQAGDVVMVMNGGAILSGAF